MGIYITPCPPKDQRSLRKRGDKDWKRRWMTTGKQVFQPQPCSCTWELIVVVTVCTRPTQTGAKWSPSKGWGKWTQSPAPRWGALHNWQLLGEGESGFLKSVALVYQWPFRVWPRIQEYVGSTHWTWWLKGEREHKVLWVQKGMLIWEKTGDGRWT